MPFAETLSGPAVVLLGMALLGVAFVLRRSGVKRAKQSTKRDLLAEVRGEADNTDKAGRSQLRELELRLHDYGREIDALAQTRIAMLRELIEAADCSAEELRELLDRAETGDDEQATAA